MSESRKPKKPNKRFPLTPHVRGGWGKRYKGHQLYIPDRDPEEALKHFNRLKVLIDDGQYFPGRRRRKLEATVFDVCNRYCVERKIDVEAQQLSEGAWKDYDDAATDMIEVFGGKRPYSDVSQDDFTRLYRHWLKKPLGAHALGRAVQCCRTIWNHAEANGWIDRRPKFGTTFRKPPTGKKEGEPFTVDQARVLIACANYNVQLEAALLLMLNGGYQSMDCACLLRAAVDFDKGLIRFPRVKMKRRRPIDRVMVMWPETAEAMREVMAERPDDVLVFRTSKGNPWVQGQTDSFRLLFQRLVEELWGEDAVRGPSWFRHLHRTLADELEKPHAAARLMGHRLPGLAEVYVDKVEHGRIQEITDHLRRRLWPCAAAPPQPAKPS